MKMNETSGKQIANKNCQLFPAPALSGSGSEGISQPRN